MGVVWRERMNNCRPKKRCLNLTKTQETGILHFEEEDKFIQCFDSKLYIHHSSTCSGL